MMKQGFDMKNLFALVPATVLSRSAKVFVTLLLPLAAIAQDSGPNLKDTLSYINSKLSEFGVAHTPCTSGGREYDENDSTGKITLSPDHRKIIHIKHDCYYTETEEIPAAAVKDVTSFFSSQATVVYLKCVTERCAHFLNENHRNGYRSGSEYDALSVDIAPNEEVGKRLSLAFKHLVELLKAEASRQLDPNDPFAPSPPKR